MSLTPQVIALLRAATEPLSTTQLREQLKAMGVWNNGDVNKRVYALCERNVVERVGGGRDTRYQLVTGDKLNQIEARSNARAAAVTNLGRRVGRRDGAPTFRDHLLQVIETTPGITVPAIKLALRDAGIAFGKNEPSAALHVLARQGRMGHVGEHPNRRYYRPIDMPEIPAATTTAPTEAKPAKAVATKRATAPATNDVATEPTPCERSRKDWHQSDDPITRLAASIEYHLTEAGTWSTAMQIAEELDEDPVQVAKAARKLVDARRANTQSLRGVREYGIGVAEETQPAPLTLASVLQAHKVEDSHGPISMPEFPGTAEFHRHIDEIAAHGIPYIPAAPPPAYCPAEVRFRPDLDAIAAAQTPEQKTRVRMINDLLDVSDAALSEAPLLDSAQWLRGDIEDLVGRACDRNADHRAIKAMTTAAFALARAIQHLHTAGTTPASTGVPQS